MNDREMMTKVLMEQGSPVSAPEIVDVIDRIFRKPIGLDQQLATYDLIIGLLLRMRGYVVTNTLEKIRRPGNMIVETKIKIADDLRSKGWAVAVHNDYFVAGQRHTFWLFTNSTTGRFAKGEGRSDEAALKQVCQMIEMIETGDAMPYIS